MEYQESYSAFIGLVFDRIHELQHPFKIKQILDMNWSTDMDRIEISITKVFIFSGVLDQLYKALYRVFQNKHPFFLSFLSSEIFNSSFVRVIGTVETNFFRVGGPEKWRQFLK
jgi:hypothetical protein